MDVSELRQIVEMFIQESDETLAQFEQCFLELEKSGPDSRVIDRLCRMSRNLRGSAAALGFDEIANFANQLEDFMSSLKDEKLVISSEIVSLLLSARDFLASGIKALRSGKKSSETGENIVEAMKNLRRKKPEFQPINLPRPAEAGDIWFVGNDLKAVLFEMPEQPQPAMIDEPKPSASLPTVTTPGELGATQVNSFTSIDPKLAAIQAEILRLTMLAAQVNLNTVQAASAFESNAAPHATNTESYSKAGPDHSETENTQNEKATEAVGVLATEDRTEQTFEISDTEASHQDGQVAPDEDFPEPEGDFGSSATNPALALAREASEQNLASHTSASEVETLLPAALLGGLGTSEEQVKIGLDRIDRLVNFVGELVILQSSIEEHKKGIDHPQLQKTFSQLAKIVREVQEISMGLRLVKVKPTYLKIQRFARDYACEINKNVEMSFWGDDVELDKAILDLVSQPLFELVKYSLKFGIEELDVRSRTNKPAQAKIEISAKRQARTVVIEIRDDGRGIDLESLRKNAIERGLLAPYEKISDEKLRSLIFHPGFSPRVTTVHGVQSIIDMNQIANVLESVQGRIHVESTAGRGTCFRVTLPLAISIVDGFVIKSGRERFVVSKAQVSETVQPHEKEIALVHGKNEMINLRGKNVPLFHLSKLLGKTQPVNQDRTTFDGIALVVQNDENKTFAVIVDDIVTQQQVVIKKLGNELQHISGLVGATILGDGKPAIILDLEELVHSQAGRQAEQGKPSANAKVA